MRAKPCSRIVRRRAVAEKGKVADGRDPLLEAKQAESAKMQRIKDAELDAQNLADRLTVRGLVRLWLDDPKVRDLR